MNVKYIGTWWNDDQIEMWEIEGDVYALYGWNGEEYLHCWKCTGTDHMTASEEEYRIKPIYGEDILDEDGDIVEFGEKIGYRIRS